MNQTTYTPAQAIAFAQHCATSAVAMYEGFMSAGFEHMGGIPAERDSSKVWHPTDAYKEGPAEGGIGCDTVYSYFAEWGALAHMTWEAVREVDNEFSAPGVFDYEVSEEFGTWFFRFAFEQGREPQADECRAELGRLCWVFFTQMPDEQHATDGPIANAVHSVTGFRAAAA
jgi:hypothetical protein